MDYKESVDYIFGHTNYEMIPRVPHAEANYDLRRVFELLERLGNPHLKAKSLHITGTNGKGSTSAMLASVSDGRRIYHRTVYLAASDYHAGTFHGRWSDDQRSGGGGNYDPPPARDRSR